MTERAAQLLDEIRAEVQAMRIQVALTEAELIAMLEVYEEFGR